MDKQEADARGTGIERELRDIVAEFATHNNAEDSRLAARIEAVADKLGDARDCVHAFVGVALEEMAGNEKLAALFAVAVLASDHGTDRDQLRDTFTGGIQAAGMPACGDCPSCLAKAAAASEETDDETDAPQA